jgi:hypothetical protein
MAWGINPTQLSPASSHVSEMGIVTAAERWARAVRPGSRLSRDSRRLLGELLLKVDSGDCWHRALVHQVGRHHAACSRLVCVARGIQADEALLMLRARDCERETGGIDSALAAADGRPPRTTGRMEKRALT